MTMKQPRLLRSVDGEMNHPRGAVAAIHGISLTHPGRQRRENQDAHTQIKSADFVVFALADGIGSTPGGAMASRLALRSLRRSLLRCNLLDERALAEGLLKANSALLEQGVRAPDLRGMGTTLVALGFCGTELFVANVGDSRAYRLRHGQLVALTQDHTVAFELVRSGVLTPEQGKVNPVAHLLTRALGTTEGLEVDAFRSTDRPRKGDRYLLCTDGLHNWVSEDRIAQLLQGEAAQGAKRLIDESNAAGGSDNITVTVIDIGSDFPVGAGDERGRVGDQEIKSIPELAPGQTVPPLEGTVWRTEKDGPGMPEAEVPRVEAHLTSALGVWLAVVSVAFMVGLLVGLGAWALFSRDTSAPTAVHSTKIAQPAPATTSLNSVTEAMSQGKSSVLQGKQVVLPDLEQLSSEYEKIADQGQRLKRVNSDLEQVRAGLDLETRKLALWYNRHQQLKNTDPLDLAESVAVSSPDVGEIKRLYEAAQQLYLKEAETLVYNPVDSEQEGRVNALAGARDERRAELRRAVISAVETGLAQAMLQVMDYSLQRDRLQAVLAALQRKKM